MKVVFDLSVTSAATARAGAGAPWDAAWKSPTSGTPAGLILDFAAGIYGAGGTAGALSSQLSLTRSSQATRFDETGALDLVSPDVARITHDPSDLAPLGLILEAASTNLVAASDAPSTQTISVAAVPHVLSFYGSGTISLSGAFSGSISGNSGFPSRNELAFTPAAGNLDLSISGDVTFAQIEEGDAATSYVSSSPAPAVRSEDIASVTLGPWFNAAEGTIVFSGALNSAQANDRILEIDSGATSTRLSILWNTVLGKPQFQVWDQGALQAAIAPAGNSIGLGDHFRVAISYAGNDFAVSLNGSAVATDTLGNMPTGLTTMRLGRSIWGAQANMIAEGLTYYPVRLSNAEVQALSA